MARMLAKGADPNRVAKHQLYFAGAGGGGSAGLVPPANETPFARALRAQDVASLRLLLAQGANPSVATEGGALPLAIACHRNMDPIGFALENFDAVTHDLYL